MIYGGEQGKNPINLFAWDMQHCSVHELMVLQSQIMGFIVLSAVVSQFYLGYLSMGMGLVEIHNIIFLQISKVSERKCNVEKQGKVGCFFTDTIHSNLKTTK